MLALENNTANGVRVAAALHSVQDDFCHSQLAFDWLGTRFKIDLQRHALVLFAAVIVCRLDLWSILRFRFLGKGKLEEGMSSEEIARTFKVTGRSERPGNDRDLVSGLAAASSGV